jgi:uncharacterized protein (TIGR03083 family)
MKPTLDELQAALRLGLAEVLSLLRSEPDVYALTPGGEWTVRDTAVHLISGPRMYTIVISGKPSRFQTPFDLSAWNAGMFLAMDEDRPSALADLYAQAVARFLDAVSRHSADDTYQYLGAPVPVDVLTATLCREQLLHGFDIASAVGRPWTSPEAVAGPAFAMMDLPTVYMFNPESAGDLRATFALESPCWRSCYAVGAGAIELLDPTIEVECTITGPSSQLLMWMSGRTPWKHAGLAASGPRSDLAPTFASMQGFI